MEWLLHSKLFKENLKKWLFMYIAVMCLVTSVITYSKYMSDFQGSGDNVRSAKFNVKISSLNEGCTNQNDKIVCNIDSKRPTQQIDFIVNLDATELEVAAEVLTRLNLLATSYEIVELEETQNGSTVKLYSSKDNVTNSKVQKTDNGSLIVKNDFNKTANKNITYKVSAIYKNNSLNPDIYGKIDEAPVLQVGYTATQAD